MDSLTPQEKRAWWLLLAASLFARLVDLGARAVSHDESLHALYSWYWSNGLNYRHDPMMHGPLLFHLNGLVFSILPVNDVTARLIPALAGTGCVAMVFFFRRWLGNRGAFFAAVLVSLDPGHLFYSRYQRNDITISLFTLILVWAVFRYREDQKPRRLILFSFALGLCFVCKEVCFIHGVMIGAGCVVFSVLETLRSPQRSLQSWLQHPWMHCAGLTLLLAFPFITGLLVPGGVWSPPGAVDAELQSRSILIGFAFIAATLLIGTGYFLWLKRWSTWIGSAAVFWFLQLSLYTTLFTNLRGGLASGLAGSLGYWWAQHDVQRGNPDPAFYLTLFLLYTPILLFGGAVACRRIRQTPYAFLLFWTVTHLGIYSWAGERMPWLLIHISLPLCLLTGAILPEIFQGTSPRKRILQGLVFLGLFQLIANSLRLAGPHAEGPEEPLVYAHTGPFLKPALLLVKDQLDRNPGTTLQIDPAYSWPTAWYLREFPAGYEEITTPDSVSKDRSVIFVSPSKREEFRAAGWVSRLEVDLTTWPRQRYHRISKENLKNLLTNPVTRKRFLDYYLTRSQPEWRPGEFPGPNRFLLMTRTPE